MKSKRVLFINSIVGSGSTGRLVSGLSALLKEKGVESLVCYGRGDDDKNTDTYRIGSDRDVYMHGALSRISDKHGLYSKKATLDLIDRIGEYKPDVIHLHNLHGYYLNYEILWEYIKKKDIPVIWTLHDCWAFTGHCTHFDYVKCERWRWEGCHDCMQLNEYPKSLLMDSTEENFRLKKELYGDYENMEIVTPSSWLKEKVILSFLNGHKMTVIPTGIDLDVFKPTDSDLRAQYDLYDKVVALGVANPWRNRKGLDDFIKLSKILPDKCRIVMIGLKKEQLSGIPQNIIALKKTESIEKLAQWYTMADLFINLTREDTFPTTNIEALACGCPVISYNTGGSPEALDDSCGRLVEKDQIKTVAALIGTMGRKDGFISRDCRKKAGEYDCRERYMQYYDSCYAKYLE